MTVVDTRKRLLGSYHPHTLDSMMDLASKYQLLGDLDSARSLKVPVAGRRASRYSRIFRVYTSKIDRLEKARRRSVATVHEKS